MFTLLLEIDDENLLVPHTPQVWGMCVISQSQRSQEGEGSSLLDITGTDVFWVNDKVLMCVRQARPVSDRFER